MKVIAAFAAAMVIAPSAFAGTSAWYETTGGKLRLVTQSAPDVQGIVRGVLEIRLDEGWKTYWKEPGETGVAPQVSLNEAQPGESVELHFPAPERFDDGVSQWAGYQGHVRLPVEFSGLGDLSSPLTLDVFLGVCETICVPVQASLEVRPGEDSGPIDDAGVDAAFTALPAEPHEGLKVAHASASDTELTIDVEISDRQDVPELFLAGHDRLMLSAPEFTPTPSGGTFTAKIVLRSKGVMQADYTLVSGNASVSGLIQPD
ncbi:protein-disulfide reductase DsbD domain-containing protein [Aliihoeflea sp. PC F10.4]